ncbi:MAG: MBL fold metallo-hydrolase [Firmicutes bacterium]|nr:MBL fold metallo-hydrolase [Bacillota bacterium]
MIQQIDDSIYCIKVPLAGSALGSLNSYFFRGAEEDFLMDTGFNTAACEESLCGSLKDLGADISRINIINTHLHADHTGLNHWFCGPDKHIYISETDHQGVLTYYKSKGYKRAERDRREGVDERTYQRMLSHGPETDKRERFFDEEKFVGLQDGDVIDTGNVRLKMILVPGHTPGNSMFYIEDKKVLFTGDHVLFDITPNITCWPGVGNALQEYLDSLERSRDLDVYLALPGHRSPGNYYERIDSILRHHQRRLDEVTGIVADAPGLTAYEIARRMKWKIHLDPDGSMPPAQMWFAAGECMSHLDKLVVDGVIVREETEPYITYRLAEQ